VSIIVSSVFIVETLAGNLLVWFAMFFLLADPAGVESAHGKLNPVYLELRETGVGVTAEDSFRLEPPYLADGLDEAEQRKRIEALGGRRYRWAELTRESTVAPQIIQLSEENPKNSDIKVRTAHVYFVAYGDFDALTRTGSVTQPENTPAREWTSLMPEDLAAKKIALADPKHENYGYVSHDLIDRVRVSGMLRTFWSQTEDSLIGAAVLDRRFEDDPDHPNRWQPLDRGGNAPKPGKASPYQGAGGYTKITKLKAPAGAVFVESHLIFAEPHGWFDGTNLLSSKLAAVIQSEVRSLRAEIKKAGEK
jgi:hypothetical protein